VPKKIQKKTEKAPAKKSSAKSSEKRPGAAKKTKADSVRRVPPRIARKVTELAQKTAEEACQPVDTAKAVAFAMSIATEMKRSAAAAEQSKDSGGIRLPRRPTTRLQGKNTATFPENDLKVFRKRLLEARARALKGADSLRATGFNESEDHEADGGDGTNQTLRLQALGHVGNINRVIQQIDEALHRIDDGTYGVCSSCGQLIRKPRLINQPFVLTCMECQSEMERGGK